MHKTKVQLYENVKDLKTKKKFEQEIKSMQKECDDLFDEDTIALLLVDEMGRNKQSTSKISDLEHGLECTVFGKITNISESKNFERKNGSSGRVVNLELTDDTGSCGLVLWDKDVELVKSNKIKEGTNVKVVNGYIKNGFTGLEVNIGRWGMLEIDPNDMPDLKDNLSSTRNEMEGTLIKVEHTRAFFRDDGSFGFVANIKIKDNDGTKQLAVWDDKVKEIQGLKQGDSISISNIDIRRRNGKEELHVNGKGIIKKL
ncbi:MAG: OB-fold nucleic acid binding domain-containing protein [Candidatus Thermoplasmatota archaeon]|nr:OB-fold nucleic acid binding domain-containing protein [Candidatus Thermoplasmatota archaeon]